MSFTKSQCCTPIPKLKLSIPMLPMPIPKLPMSMLSKELLPVAQCCKRNTAHFGNCTVKYCIVALNTIRYVTFNNLLKIWRWPKTAQKSYLCSHMSVSLRGSYHGFQLNRFFWAFTNLKWNTLMNFMVFHMINILWHWGWTAWKITLWILHCLKLLCKNFKLV